MIIGWIKAADQLRIQDWGDFPSLDLVDEVVSFDGCKHTSLHDAAFREDCAAIRDLLRSPWWTRGWIHQEALVARKILILFGPSIMEWDALSLSIQALYRVAMILWRQEQLIINEDIKRLLLLGPYEQSASFTIRQRRYWQKERQENLLRLLTFAADCDVTDDRDRIFAFSGLADPGYKIIPDYTAEVSVVIKHTCKRIILFDQNLNSLTCCTPDAWKYPEREVPSWCTDWSVYGVCMFSFIYDPVYHAPAFQASAYHNSIVNFHDADSILEVQGLFIDQVATETSCGQAAYQEHYTERDVESWKKLAGLTNNSKQDKYAFDDTLSLQDAF